MNYLLFGQLVGKLNPNKTYLVDGITDIASQADVDSRLSVVVNRLPDGTCETSNDPQIVNVKYENVLAFYDSYVEEVEKNKCKEKAKELIASSDWSVLSDVSTTLTNQNEFIAYRTILRNLIINPEVNPQFPTEPVPIWG